MAISFSKILHYGSIQLAYKSTASHVIMTVQLKASIDMNPKLRCQKSAIVFPYGRSFTYFQYWYLA